MKLYEIATPSIAASPEEWHSYRERIEQDLSRRAVGLAKFIKMHCQPWLSQTQNGQKLVYRGFSRTWERKGFRLPGQQDLMYFIRPVRKDRRPLNTAAAMHHKLNAELAKCGAVANRTNSVFVTGSHQQASYYGTVYIIVPIGQFNYTWSPEYSDWYEKDHLIVQAIQDGTFCDKIRWDNNTLDSAIDSWGEIMIACQQYLAVRTDIWYKVAEHL